MTLSTNTSTAAELRICDVGGGGLLLPLFGDAEQRWPKALRAILYMIGLGWCFMGVAIVADIFMGAIECITSQKSRKFNPKTQRFVTCKVWNPTVANLTLMALGSSAPEILLSVIELFGNSMFSGELGPSTIVGSAAFNLLCIIAVCVCSIPEGEHRKIKELPVYVVTASFSIFAYLWLLIILMGSSENVVEPWEGAFTFLMFPALVGLAFLADRGYFSSSKSRPEMGQGVVLSAAMSKEELAELELKIRREHGSNLTTDQVASIARIQNAEKQSRAQYRVAATRALTGAKRVHVADSAKDLARISQKVPIDAQGKVLRQTEEPGDGNCKLCPPAAIIEFGQTNFAVLENAGSVSVSVKRYGHLDSTVHVNYKTRNGAAHAGEDYKHAEGTLTFAPNETEQLVSVTIIDDIAYEDDEDFFLDLSGAKSDDLLCLAQLGDHATATIVIIDDDHPGVIAFPNDELYLEEGEHDKENEIVVSRKNGASGKVSVKYKTEDSGAVSPHDYDAVQGVLLFEPGQTQAVIKVNIKARGRYESQEDFRLILTEPTGGAKLDKEMDGGADSCILTIILQSNQAAKDRIDRLMSALAVNWDKAKVGHTNWRAQILSSIYVNGGDEEDEPPSCQDWVLHIITVPWKVLFALVPPVDYCGGWLCFCCSLAMIGLVTAIIGDMASLFGCCLGIPDDVTAITFVALGTSLPDTFASKTAAMEDPYADASIGNVTGSNSVNVFLGLGLPWLIGSIFWSSGEPNDEWKRKYSDDGDIPSRFREGAFVVKAGNLAFSVIVFSSCAVACIILLYIRRLTCKGELGGPTAPKIATTVFLVFLWLLYVALSSWKSINDS